MDDAFDGFTDDNGLMEDNVGLGHRDSWIVRSWMALNVHRSGFSRRSEVTRLRFHLLPTETD